MENTPIRVMLSQVQNASHTVSGILACQARLSWQMPKILSFLDRPTYVYAGSPRLQSFSCLTRGHAWYTTHPYAILGERIMLTARLAYARLHGYDTIYLTTSPTEAERLSKRYPNTGELNMADPEIITIENPVFHVFVPDSPDPDRVEDFIEVTPEDAERLGPDTEPNDVVVYDLNTQRNVRIVRRECGQEAGCWHEMVATWSPETVGRKTILLKKRS